MVPNTGSDAKIKRRGKSPARQASEAAKARRAEKAKASKAPGTKSPVQVAQAKSREEVRLKDKAQRLQRYKELEELRTRAIQAGLVVHGLNPVEVLQRLIDDAFIAYALAQQEADEYLTSTSNNLLDQKVIRNNENRARALRREAAYFAGLSVQYNLQDRQTKVQEARLGLMVTVIQRVLRHPDIDLPPEKVRQIPRLMQKTLHTMRQGQQDQEEAA